MRARFIDTHRHLLFRSRADSADALAQWTDDVLTQSLAELLASGVTTTISLNDF